MAIGLAMTELRIFLGSLFNLRWNNQSILQSLAAKYPMEAFKKVDQLAPLFVLVHKPWTIIRNTCYTIRVSRSSVGVVFELVISRATNPLDLLRQVRQWRTKK